MGEQCVRVRILSGTQKGKELDVTSSSGYLFGAACTPGLKVILMQSVAGETTIASVYTQDREWVIYLFAGLYLLSLLLVGGVQGLKGCLGGLVFTFFCVIFVYLPLIYLKYSPFWTAVFICFLTTLVTMYLIGGPSRKTAAATSGTLAGVIIAGLSAWIFSMASGITGYNVSDIESLMTLWNTNGIQVGGLLFSGLLFPVLAQSWTLPCPSAAPSRKVLRPESFPDPVPDLPCRNAHRKGYDGNGQQYPDPGFCRKQCQHVASELRLRPSLSADYQFQ